MRNNRNSIVENVILFLAAIGVFAIIGGFAGWWSGSDDEEYYDNDIECSFMDLPESLEKSMEGLREKEILVLRLRFGFENESKTYDEIGTILNVTRERVRQIEAKALRKLRHPSRSESLRLYID